jgi:hypothetical protein
VIRALVACVVLAACRPGPTEIVVVTDTAFGVPCTIDALRLEIDGTIVDEVEVGPDDLPGSITLATDDPRNVTVRVTGLRAGEPFAVGEERVAFEDETSLELRFLLDRACVPGPCPAVGIGGFTELPSPVARRGCGDASYGIAESLFVVRDACDMAEASMGTVLSDADELEAPSPLTPAMPFPFRFYGELVTQVWVGDNGYVAFSTDPPDALNANGASNSLGDPAGSFPVRGVLPFWDDLRTGTRGVCFAASGESPDRILWITWREACFKAGATPCGPAAQGTLTFTVALEETTDRIYFGYQTMTGAGGTADRARGLTATIGITGGTVAGCTADQCSAAGVCADGVTPCGYTEHSSDAVQAALPTLEIVPR